MRHSRPLLLLASLVALLAAAAAATGLFWNDGGSPFSFTTVHGQTIEIYGRGLYHYDTLFKAPILRGTDAVTLVLSVPLLIFSILRYRRGSLRGGILLTSMLAYFLYNSASLAFGVAYNILFPLYLVYFSASLFAFWIALQSIDAGLLAEHASSDPPYRALSIFLFVAGVSLLVWLLDIVGAILTGAPPEGLASYTTEITYVIDLGVIAPAAFLASRMMARRSAQGLIPAAVLLTLNAIIGVVVLTQTLFQSMAGIVLTTEQMVAFVGIFAFMSLIAIRLDWRLFHCIDDRPRSGTTNRDGAPMDASDLNLPPVSVPMVAALQQQPRP